MRVCLDTNILVSGIFWKGVPGIIVDRWVEGSFELIVSPPILDEYYRILRRMTAKMEAGLAERWMTMIVENALLVSAPITGQWSRDHTDDMFIACALIGEADYLVTGDKDLLALEDTTPVTILKAQQLLTILE